MSKQSSDSPPEQRSYSVDEMMARLREGEREKREQDEGELVTRPDGTQVLRVRRRKRRSKQPVAETRKRTAKSRKFVIPLVLGVMVLLGLAVILLVAKYNSKGFQDDLESRLADVTGSKISITRMVVTPIKVRAQSVESRWSDGGMMEGLTLAGLEADLKWTSFLRGALKVDRIQSGRGLLQLGPGQFGVAPSEVHSGTTPLAYKELRCQQFDVRYGDEKTSGALLKNTEATLVTPEGGATQIRFDGGELLIAGWSPLKVDLGLGQLTSGGFELTSFRMAPSEGGGEMNLTTAAAVQSGRPVQMDIQMANFPLESILGPDLGRMFSGSVNSNAGSIVFGNDGQPRSDTRIEFSGQSGRMEGLPFLENLRTRLGDTDFVRPEFGAVQGVFRRSAEGTELQGLILESPGLLMVRGFVELSATGDLSGTLEIGIAESKMIKATGRKSIEAFSDPSEGYCWLTVTLSGDVKRPDDNFKNLLQKSARESYERRDEGPSGDRFDELTRPR